MSTTAMLLNVIDVEATCWDGEVPRGQVSEIIEIGVCVVDLTARRRTGRHAILVKPQRSTVSEFCTQLTGLTQDEVDSGLVFSDACRALGELHAAGERRWASWGDYDRQQFEAQCASTGVRYPFESGHVNAKAVFADAYRLRRRPGMAQALQIADIPLEGRHHRGVDDAWNIGALILRLLDLGAWPAMTGGAEVEALSI